MPIFKVRAGDHDLVDIEFSSFHPGENLRTIGLERAYDLKPVKGTVSVRSPAAGGGALGFALQLYCYVDVSCTASETTIDYSRKPMVQHFVHLFKKVTGYKGGFRIHCKDHGRLHVGLGSTSTIMISLAAALNHAVGSPLTMEQLRKLVGHNYVEETPGDDVSFAFETGVGPAVSLYGGMGIMGDELALAYHHSFGEGKNVFVVTPPSDSFSGGAHEFDLLMNKARSLDYRDRELKAYLMLMDMIPAIENDDLERMGDVLWEIQLRGSKRAEVEHHGFKLFGYMNQLREAGLELVGMSSVGPSIAIITEKDHAFVEGIVKKMGFTIGVESKVDNEGIKISHAD
jgi:predicted sugar kinase